MSAVTPWFERRFAFGVPVDEFPNIKIRLWGTPARLDELLRDVHREVLVYKSAGKWSAQEHAGHLADMESLWLGRANDFLDGRLTLTPADLTNRRTDEANHNACETEVVLREFRRGRTLLVNRLQQLSE